MPDNDSIALQTCETIEEQFDFHPAERLRDLEESVLLTRLHSYLAERILDMMNRNFEQLMNTLYRIDVDEEAVKHIFKGAGEEAIAAQLANLVIERQRQKAETRAAFKRESGTAPGVE